MDILEKTEKLLKELKAGVKSLLPSIKMPSTNTIKSPKASFSAPKISAGVSPTSQKSPVKQIEQIKTSSIKDQKMQEAQKYLSLKKEEFSVNNSTGQWSLGNEPLSKPFASDAQRRYMFAQRGKEVPAKVADEFAAATPKGVDLPEKVKKDECEIKDGKADSEYDADQLAAGIKVEMEHTDDPKMAKKIAKIHLDENAKYYTHLKEMESKF